MDLDSTTTSEEMTVFLASDVKVEPQQIKSWIVTVVVDQGDGQFGIAVRAPNKDDHILMFAQIEAICNAVTGSVNG